MELKAEFRRMDHGYKRAVILVVNGLTMDKWTSDMARDPYSGGEKMCAEELDRWNAEEPEKLEPLTDEELLKVYYLPRETPNGVTAGLRAVVTAHDKRKAEIAVQMVEADLVEELWRVWVDHPDGFSSLKSALPAFAAKVREYDQAKRVVFEAECTYDRKREDGLRVVHDPEECDFTFLFNAHEHRDLAVIITPTKAAELARTLDPDSYKELERLRELTTPCRSMPPEGRTVLLWSDCRWVPFYFHKPTREETWLPLPPDPTEEVG